MSGDSTNTNSAGISGQGLVGSPLTATAIQQQWAQAMQQYNPTTWTTSGTTWQYNPPPLDPNTASDLIAQLEHDRVLVADHKLLFGQHMGKSLREVPLEYLVQLGAASRGLRQQLVKELRRRRALERLTKQ